MRLGNQIMKQIPWERLVYPNADPAFISYIRGLEETKAFYEEILLLKIGLDRDRGPITIDLEHCKGATRNFEVWMPPGNDFFNPVK